MTYKKTYDIMNELTDSFIRGSNFESAMKFCLDTAVEWMGFTGAFYLDEKLNLLATPYTSFIPITEFILPLISIKYQQSKKII